MLKQKREEEKQQIIDYRRLTEELLQLRNKHEYSNKALQKTTKLLIINPEFNTIWNYRRDIIKELSQQLDCNFWDGELEFTMERLKFRPKVYWIWNHRVWCLHNYPGSPMKIWLRELAIVEKLLEMDSRNFNGWNYRRFIVGMVEKIRGCDMNKDEFDFTTSKINQNISNFSAWFQRTTLIPKMIDSGAIKNLQEFIKQEIEYIQNAMFTDAEDQSVWMYIKWFITNKDLIDHMSPDQYSSILKKLVEDIVIINQDEISFCGKANVWCLKTLIVIEAIQKNQLNESVEEKSRSYLEELVQIDPLRKNRYLYQLASL